jgi:hypothetical protein
MGDLRFAGRLSIALAFATALAATVFGQVKVPAESRDSTGRVRIERYIEGLAAPKTRSERHIRTIVAPDPSRWAGVFTG